MMRYIHVRVALGQASLIAWRFLWMISLLFVCQFSGLK